MIRMVNRLRCTEIGSWLLRRLLCLGVLMGLMAFLGAAHYSSPETEPVVGVEPKPRLVGRLPGDSCPLAFLSGGDKPILITCPNSTLYGLNLWDVRSGKHLGSFLSGARGLYMNVVGVSPDGKYVAAAGHDYYGDDISYHIHLWDARTRKLLARMPGHTGSINGLAFCPDNKRLVSSGRDCMVRVWDIATRKQLFNFVAGENDLSGLALSADGKMLATPAWGSKNAATLWDLATGKRLRDLKGKGDSAFRKTLSFISDGKLLAGAGVYEDRGGPTRLWDVASGKLLDNSLSTVLQVRHLAFRPDGRWLVSADFQEVRIWDTATFRLLYRLPHKVNAERIAFSPDSQWMAVAAHDDDTYVALWQLFPKRR